MTARTKQELYDYFSSGGSASKSISQIEQEFEDLIDSIGPVALSVVASDASDSSKGRADYLCDGAADEVEIQAAIDALPSGRTTKARVILSEGTFTISSQITVASYTIIELLGKIFLAASSDDHIYRVSDTQTQIEFIGGTLDGNETNQGASNKPPIQVASSTYVRVQDVRVKNSPGYGINVIFSDHVEVINCETTGSRNDGIYVRKDGDAWVNILGCRSVDDESGIYIYNSNYVNVQNCHIENATDHSLVIESISGTTNHHLNFVGNTIKGSDNNDSGIWLRAGNDDANRLKTVNVLGNVITNCEHAIIVAPYVYGSNIVGNVIDACADGIYAQGLKYSNIEDNVITACTTHGINVIAGSDTINIQGNTLDGNTPELADAGSATNILANVGWVTENSGTSSIASGDTTKVVAHGLDATPTYANVAFTEQGTNDYGRVWVSALGSTGFTLNVSADPGASNLDFAWEAKVR